MAKITMTSENTIIAACARAAHETNRAYCFAIGDDSQPPWESAPEWQKESAVQGVRGVLAGNTAEQSHETWWAQKRATGWTWGPTKDPERKQHPCMVPYAELAAEQRAKGALYIAVVRATAIALGMDPPRQSVDIRIGVDADKVFLALEGGDMVLRSDLDPEGVRRVRHALRNADEEAAMRRRKKN